MGLSLDSLDEAVKLRAQLQQWQEALKRCDVGLFKSATLTVTDAGHGHQGQQGETRITILDADEIRWFITSQLDEVIGRLRDMGLQV